MVALVIDTSDDVVCKVVREIHSIVGKFKLAQEVWLYIIVVN